MTTYARVVGSTAVEISTIDPATIFSAAHAALFSIVPDGTQVGWVQGVGGIFGPPVAAPLTSAQLVAYAAAARYNIETGGITVSGAKIATDRDSQSMITGAWASAQINPATSVQWKSADGTWVPLSAQQITAIATAVSTHVQACFAAEKQCDAGINATPPTITSPAQIDALFVAI